MRCPRVRRRALSGGGRGGRRRERPHLRLAEQDRARVAKPGPRGRVEVRYEVLEDERVRRRADPGREVVVLDRERHARQRRPAGHPVGGPGRLDRVPGNHGVERLIAGVPAADPREIRFHEFDRADIAVAKESRRLGEREFGQLRRLRTARRREVQLVRASGRGPASRSGLAGESGSRVGDRAQRCGRRYGRRGQRRHPLEEAAPVHLTHGSTRSLRRDRWRAPAPSGRTRNRRSHRASTAGSVARTP